MKTSSKLSLLPISLVTALAALMPLPAAAKPVAVNVVLNADITPAILQSLRTFGSVGTQLPQIRGLTMMVESAKLPALRRLASVAAAELDGAGMAAPIEAVDVPDFTGGSSMWDHDAINVTDFGVGRTETYTGEGVYVAVLDTGLVQNWPSYFPADRIATEYGVNFLGADQGRITTQPGMWQRDVNTHGTHVTSTILGFAHHTETETRYINGVAPRAKVIPVKVLHQNGGATWSMISRGIVYTADLKAGPLAGHPVVINMSLGGNPGDPLSPLLKAAMDYALAKGVVIVAAAGNSGDQGMGFPGAYAPVISAAASALTDNNYPSANSGWWFNTDVSDPLHMEEFYIAPWSSRALPGQDLDVTAPGRWIFGPWEDQHGHIQYELISGTSMASPHVAGIVALMLQKNPTLTAPQVEAILEASAVPMAADTRQYLNAAGVLEETTWGANATGAGLTLADAALALTPAP